jgi:hypothetical protein
LAEFAGLGLVRLGYEGLDLTGKLLDTFGVVVEAEFLDLFGACEVGKLAE